MQEIELLCSREQIMEFRMNISIINSRYWGVILHWREKQCTRRLNRIACTFAIASLFAILSPTFSYAQNPTSERAKEFYDKAQRLFENDEYFESYLNYRNAAIFGRIDAYGDAYAALMMASDDDKYSRQLLEIALEGVEKGCKACAFDAALEYSDRSNYVLALTYLLIDIKLNNKSSANLEKAELKTLNYINDKLSAEQKNLAASNSEDFINRETNSILESTSSLPNNVAIDVLMSKLVKLLGEEKYYQSTPIFKRLRDLSNDLPESFYYYEADTLSKSANVLAKKRASEFISKFGSSSKYYARMIEILAQ